MNARQLLRYAMCYNLFILPSQELLNTVVFALLYLIVSIIQLTSWAGPYHPQFRDPNIAAGVSENKFQKLWAQFHRTLCTSYSPESGEEGRRLS